MKLSNLLAVTAATFCVVSIGQDAQAFGIKPTCDSYFSKAVSLDVPHTPDDSGSWRSAITNSQSSGVVAPTSAAREAWINKAMGSQLTFLNSHRDTPEMVLVLGEGVQSKVLNPEATTGVTPIPLNYEKGPVQTTHHFEDIPKIEVSGLGPNGVLKATLLLPVSGHTDITLGDANRWAKTDLYKVVTADANGRQTGTIVVNAPSRGVITVQEFEIQMTPGVPVQVQYARNGSLGVAGYAEGRVYELVWDGK